MILQCPINSLGYGVAGYNIAKQLSLKLGSYSDFENDPVVEWLSVVPIGQPERELYQELVEYDWRNIKSDEVWNHATEDTNVKIWHQNGLHEMVGKEKRIGFPIFELNQFTREEVLSMKTCDDIFVCSKWAKDVIKDKLNFRDDKVRVVPLGVDRNIFNENNNTSRSSTIFFNCGKWEKRKGHDIIRECFERAFSPQDNVELWMMCENPFLGDDNNKWINHYMNSGLSNKIKIIPRQKYQRDVYNIMRQIDIGVFPVRAEGWNLELIELLSCGKHVITTDYSGHTEFTDRNNSHIVEIDKLEVAQDGVWFHGQGEWAELGERQKDQIISHMRKLHKQKQDSELDINLAGIETAIKFSWENTAREILDGI